MTRRAQHGSPSQRAGQRDQTRARIIEATVDSIAALGAAGASLGAIVERAQVSKSLIDYHFGSQANLLLAAFDRHCEGFLSMLGIAGVDEPAGREHAARQHDAVARLDWAICRSFEWSPRFHERQYAWFGFWALARTNPALEAANRGMNLRVARHLGGLLEAAAEQLGVEIDALAAGYQLTAAIDGAWLHLTTNTKGFTRADAVAMCRRYAKELLRDGADGAG